MKYKFITIMKLSYTTLQLMRHSTSAVMAAATISTNGLTQAHPTISAESIAMSSTDYDAQHRNGPVDDETKKDEEKKKEGERAVCLGCGLG